MLEKDKILIAAGAHPVYLLPQMVCRHGLIAGADENGKTKALRVLAEAFSSRGVPVFLSDTKGDTAALAESFPLQFWDLNGQQGHPVRTTVSEMGSLLLARILGLNETQSGVLNIAFRIADEKGLLLIDLKDLKAMLQYLGKNSCEFTLTYGNISRQTIGAILRNLIALEDQGGERFFGEPALDISDWVKTTEDGHGIINILYSVGLSRSPVLYSTFLLWMLSELFETLPETKASDNLKFVFFFDSAQILFRSAPRSLLERIEQAVSLAKDKGIGIFFIAGNPADLPAGILKQLGNRILITAELDSGEALISCLDAEGGPGIEERASIHTPESRIEETDSTVRGRIVAASILDGKYDRVTDRRSAFEQIRENEMAALETEGDRKAGTQKREVRRTGGQRSAAGRGYTRQTPMEKAINAVFSTIGREVGRTLIRGILGSLKK